MKKTKKDFLMNPWTITIGGGVTATLIGSVITDLIKKENIFSTFGCLLKKAGDVLFPFLNFEIKVWWLLLFFAVVLMVRSLLLKMRSMDNTIQQPRFVEYRSDTIKGYKWKWAWRKNYDGKYCIEGLHPVCSKCDTPLLDIYHYRDIRCDRCGYSHSQEMPEMQTIEMLIQDNVRRRYFPEE